MRITQISENIELNEVTYDDDDMSLKIMAHRIGTMMTILLMKQSTQGRKVKLGKPMAGDVKKFKVYEESKR